MNSIYAEMLREQGIEVDWAPPLTPPPESPNYNYPYYNESGEAFYTSTQLEFYGIPDGDYYVVEEQRYGLNYDDERRIPKHRKPNIYNRFKRFRMILSQMLGGVKVHTDILEDIADHLGVKYKIEQVFIPRKFRQPVNYRNFVLLERFECDRDTIWEKVRKYCRKKHSKHYNKIPSILNSFGVEKPVITPEQYGVIIDQFISMDHFFNDTRKSMGVVYFPSLRYTVLRLLEKNGITYNYTLPFVATKRKIKPLGEKLEKLFVASDVLQK
jgi:hypothetical protein